MQRESDETAGKTIQKPPKRALSAFVFFCLEWRERIKAENPDAAFSDIGKLLGAMWQEMDDEEKMPYIEQAAIDKAREEAEVREYEASRT